MNLCNGQTVDLGRIQQVTHPIRGWPPIHQVRQIQLANVCQENSKNNALIPNSSKKNIFSSQKIAKETGFIRTF